MIRRDPVGYRADIDGLRAVSVAAVVLFHAFPDAVPGGFAGVDVFFVVSGFLISHLLWAGFDGGTLTLSRFYERRIRRILPATAVVCAATTACSLYFLAPGSFTYFSASLMATWLFTSNIFFSMLSSDYFTQLASERPLLHTWSLGVEEQFYFVFPLLLLAVRRWRLAPKATMGALFLVFLALSQWGTGTSNAYYLPQFRAHELLAGSLVFFLGRGERTASLHHATAWSVAGALLVLGSFAALGDDASYPGLHSLAPTVGAAVLVWAGASRNSVAAVLGSRPLVRMGQLSFSLYLWHWPMLVFMKMRGIALSPPVFVAFLAALFLVSWLSWRFVEMPLRRQEPIGLPKVAGYWYALPALAFVGLGIASFATQGFSQRFSGELGELMSSYSSERDLARRCSVRQGERAMIDVAHLGTDCAFGDVSQPAASVILYGDSHANHFKPFVDALARDAGLKAVYSVMGSCAPVTNAERAHDGIAGLECARRNRSVEEQAGRYRFVVLSGVWRPGADPAQWEDALLRTARNVVAQGAVPIVFKDSPWSTIDRSQCVLKRARGWLPAATDCEIPRSEVELAGAAADRAIERVGQLVPVMRIVDPKLVMCDAARCRTSQGNTAFYRDSNHLNAQASEMLGRRWLADQGNPLRTVAAGDADGQLRPLSAKAGSS